MNLDEVTLRKYRTGDWEAMYALDLLCFEPPFRFSRGAMRKFAETANSVSLLAEVQGRLVGFCVAHVEDSVAYVVTLDVAPDWRRRGVAAKLMVESEARALAEGALAMALHVYDGNTGAIRFYESMGYELIGTADGFYGNGLDARVYTKKA